MWGTDPNPVSQEPLLTMFRALTLLGLLGAAVGIFFGAKGALTAKDAVDSVNAKGGDSSSMFRAKNLDEGLGKIRAKVGADGQLLQLNVYPGYIVVDASSGSEDKGRSFRVQQDGRVDELPVTLTGPGRLKDNVFPIAKLDSSTVEKLASETAAKEHTDLNGITHIVAMIDPVSGNPTINVYAASSRYWHAGLDGKNLASAGQDASKALDDVNKTVDAATKQASAAASGADDVAACVSAAGADAAKLAACTK
jgi:hypothetical protein